jgi:hypothetical protein
LADLDHHWRYLEGEWAAARAAPLSLRRAMLVALLVDGYVDRLFAAMPGADDVLVFRAEMAQRAPALGLTMALAAQRDDARLLIEAVAVPLAEYASLAVADFMVSLYNDHSVQRVRLVTSDGGSRDFHETLAEAMAALDATRKRLDG